MKKSEEIRRRTWRMLAKNLIVLAALAVAAIVGVMSWFKSEIHSDARGIQIECKRSNNLEIAILAPGENNKPDDGDWKNASEHFELDKEDFAFLNDLNMTQVTGDGISFIKPYLKQEDAVAVADDDADVVWADDKIETQANQDYISFDLYMRTNRGDCKVVLDNGTYFGPLDPGETFPSSDDGKKLSEASVIGAARMSVLDSTFSSRKLLWIPAPHLYYAYDTIWTDVTDTATSYGLAKDRTDSSLTYIYGSNFNGTYRHTYWTRDKVHRYIDYDSDGSEQGTKVTAFTDKSYRLTSGCDIASLTKKLDTLTGKASDSGYWYDVVRVNIWLEGEDPEARAAQVGGEFKVTISLSLTPDQ